MIRRLLKYTLLPFFLFLVLSGLKGQCYKGNNAFSPGEKISYDISYNWGPIWVDAGLVTFSIGKEIYNGKDAWHLQSVGKTYSSYDFLFKVRDYYDAWVDPSTFKFHEFRRMVYEGGYSLINNMKYDHKKELIYSTTKSNNNPVRFDTLKGSACAFDMVSAVYFVRTLDISVIQKDIKTPVSVLIDDNIYDIYIRYLGKEIVQNKDGKRYNCVKFSARMVEGTIFRGDEDVMVWVTDDSNKIPVYIEAKILVGTVKAYLKDVKGLRTPLKPVK
ncbi:MAG TPA: DUF3108 domain-containing protein [Bacteroidales bacterium]|nr:DUF3108 domain-containing protein [Bacteroidales bacterium]